MVTTKDFCVEHSESCVTDAYLAGYKQAIEDAAKVAEDEERKSAMDNSPFLCLQASHIARRIKKLAGREDGG
jgi:hypothetical protein